MTQSTSRPDRLAVHHRFHHGDTMTAAAAASHPENGMADTSVYVAGESGVAVNAASTPRALETIDAIVKRRQVSADATVESPSDQRAFWKGQREVLASDAAFQSVGGAAFGMSSAMAPPLAAGVPGAPPPPSPLPRG